MRNLYLYINYKNNLDICNNYKDIFCFKNKLVCIDKNKYSKSKIYDLQKELKIKPYFVSQDIFKEILYALVSNKISFRVRDIEFIDESIRKESEYIELEDIIREIWTNKKAICRQEKLNLKLYENILNIINEYDTEIKSINLIYSKMDIELTNKGVLNFNSTDELLCNLINDNILNRILLGNI